MLRMIDGVIGGSNGRSGGSWRDNYITVEADPTSNDN